MVPYIHGQDDRAPAGGAEQSLRRMAAVSGCSEAELIREAVATHIRAFGRPRSRGRLFAKQVMLTVLR